MPKRTRRDLDRDPSLRETQSWSLLPSGVSVCQSGIPRGRRLSSHPKAAAGARALCRHPGRRGWGEAGGWQGRSLLEERRLPEGALIASSRPRVRNLATRSRQLQGGWGHRPRPRGPCAGIRDGCGGSGSRGTGRRGLERQRQGHTGAPEGSGVGEKPAVTAPRRHDHGPVRPTYYEDPGGSGRKALRATAPTAPAQRDALSRGCRVLFGPTLRQAAVTSKAVFTSLTSVFLWLGLKPAGTFYPGISQRSSAHRGRVPCGRPLGLDAPTGTGSRGAPGRPRGREDGAWVGTG